MMSSSTSPSIPELAKYTSALIIAIFLEQHLVPPLVPPRPRPSARVSSTPSRVARNHRVRGSSHRRVLLALPQPFGYMLLSLPL